MLRGHDADKALIVLDPYVLGILPQSLVPTGVYLVILAAASWYLSGYIWTLLDRPPPPQAKSHTS